MSPTLSTILAILIMMLSIVYLILYWIKKKNNKPLQAFYKITFASIFVLLAIYLINSLV